MYISYFLLTCQIWNRGMMKCFYVGSNSNADFAHSNVTLKSKQTADKRTSGQAKKKKKETILYITTTFLVPKS